MSEEGYEEPYPDLEPTGATDRSIQKVEPEYWMADCMKCGAGKLLRISRVAYNDSRKLMIPYWLWKCKNPHCNYEVK